VSALLTHKGKKAQGGMGGQASIVLPDGLSFMFSAINDYKTSNHSSTEVGQIPTLLYYMPEDFKTEQQVFSLIFHAFSFPSLPRWSKVILNFLRDGAH
jgi:hypothetical protein